MNFDPNPKVTIVPLSDETLDQIADMAVFESQAGYIESAQDCLKDFRTNAYGIAWRMDGIYADKTLVGFAMHGRQPFQHTSYSQVWLDRFMIDRRFQGKGYGKSALRLIIPRLYDIYQCKKIYLSVKEDNLTAIKLYESMGFKKTVWMAPHAERIMIHQK